MIPAPPWKRLTGEVLQMLRRIVVAVAACLVAGSALAVAPQRTFVASYGNDLWPCSLAQPCRGFQAAINAVAPGGEVVALDSAGYGAMEIHKSVSVIVPTGIHAGLSPSTGIPLPGYPGQSGVVLIDIADTDVVVLRGLNINHQGTVTGGIEWISAHSGTVHIENVVVNGFPKEGLYMQAPAGTLFIKHSVFRNNYVGIYGAMAGGPDTGIPGGIFADHVHVEKSNTGVRVLSNVHIGLSNSEITSNTVAFDVQATTGVTASVSVDRCTITSNGSIFTLNGVGGGFSGTPYAVWESAASIIVMNGTGTRTGPSARVNSYGNNSLVRDNLAFDSMNPPK
jgi:hypothetical protein